LRSAWRPDDRENQVVRRADGIHGARRIIAAEPDVLAERFTCRDAFCRQLSPPSGVAQRLPKAWCWQERTDIRIAQQDDQIIAAENARKLPRLGPPFGGNPRERTEPPPQLVHDSAF
jgi:hypothetical protein